MRSSEYQTHQDWQNIMQNRHGASENALQKCAQCCHLVENSDGSPVCVQFTTPGGYLMPWRGGNHACGLFTERTPTP